MDLVFSFFVWIALLVFAYHFCTTIGDYSSDEPRLLPEGLFFRTLEKLGLYLSLLGLVWFVGGVVWMMVLAYTTGVIAEIFGF